MFNYFASENDDNSKTWLTTYADLITLMLTFFIILFSMTTMELDKFKSMSKAIKEGFGNKALRTTETNEMATKGNYNKEVDDLKQTLLDDVKSFAEKNHIDKSIIITMENGHLVIRIKENVFFAVGTADLYNTAYPILDDIVLVIKNYKKFRVDIAGHTDDRPINNLRFPSNWELSAHRATSVLRYFIELGIDPHRLTATGYGDIMPLVPNTNLENRNQNRRVEFVMDKEID